MSDIVVAVIKSTQPSLSTSKASTSRSLTSSNIPREPATSAAWPKLLVRSVNTPFSFINNKSRKKPHPVQVDWIEPGNLRMTMRSRSPSRSKSAYAKSFSILSWPVIAALATNRVELWLVKETHCAFALESGRVASERIKIECEIRIIFFLIVFFVFVSQASIHYLKSNQGHAPQPESTIARSIPSVTPLWSRSL